MYLFIPKWGDNIFIKSIYTPKGGVSRDELTDIKESGLCDNITVTAENRIASGEPGEQILGKTRLLAKI